MKATLLILALAAPLTLTRCISDGGTGGGLVSSGSLSTPSHSMSRSEYPFDDQGNYREDWVQYPSGAKVGEGSASSSRRSSSGASSTRSTAPSSSTRISTTPPPTRSTSTTTSSSSGSRTHTVAQGDTLWGISRKYGVSVSAIQAKNGIHGTLIRPGQKLRIP